MDPLREQARQRPEAEAISAGASWTFAELDEQADRLARRLAGARVAGRVVAAIVPSGPQAAWTIHGAPRAGATLAMLNPGWTKREFVDHLQLVDPEVVVCTRDTEQHAALVTQGAHIVNLDQPGGTRSMHLETLPEAEPAGLDAADPHTLVPTTGTSGRPKATAFQLDTHVAHARAAVDRLDLSAGDRWLAALSPAHIGGLAVYLRAAVSGACIVPQPTFEPAAVRQAIEAEAVTHASLVPAMLDRLIEHEAQAPASLETVLVGGDACPNPLLERALDHGWPISLTYGMTETASQACTAPPALVREKPGTVGPPLDTVEIRIEDERIHVRGETLAEGYLGAELEIDEDGWLATGDAGELDEDGHLWVTGRLSARIVSGGASVDPVEVEDVLREHPGVAEACVVGVPDERWGEIVTAAVVPREVGTLDAETLATFCEGKLANPKRPRAWTFLDELPRNANGKVDRGAVVDAVE
jgi:O-succinylbenzoic acid--CoA ligase